MLKEAIEDYLRWMESQGYAEKTRMIYGYTLRRFLLYAGKTPWSELFTVEMVNRLRKKVGIHHISPALKGLSRYLYRSGKISRPITKPTRKLPELFEQYLEQARINKGVGKSWRANTFSTLSAFNDYLSANKIELERLKIENVDSFLAQYCDNGGEPIRRDSRFYLRGFFRHLYERKILNRDLAPLLTCKPQFAEAKPSRFLRPHETQRLFAVQDLDSLKGIRTNAIIRLGYALGLRPKEISLISLDDIFFAEAEIRLRDRKSGNPIKLPLPESVIKAIAAYVMRVRPKSPSRRLFLRLRAPHSPMNAWSVSGDITASMGKANLPASAYWLRHTYAQNLLTTGASIFEIKEMLGHDRIQTTKRYIHIDTVYMRRTLFDETI